MTEHAQPGIRERIKDCIPRNLLIRDLGSDPGNRVLLTFDDGPNPEVTPAVLDRLDTHDVRSVFFVVGRLAAAAPEILRDIHARGHHLGNHSYWHANDGDPWFLAYLRDLRRCQALVQRETGVTPRLFRPPKGHLSPTSLSTPRLLGMRLVNWSTNVRDWACRSQEQALAAAEQLVRLTKPGDIVLLHDGNRFVIDILDYALPKFVASGLDLRTAVDRL
jgi:peptidoglycan-N-acetylglucosamine deacetylase